MAHRFQCTAFLEVGVFGDLTEGADGGNGNIRVFELFDGFGDGKVRELRLNGRADVCDTRGTVYTRRISGVIEDIVRIEGAA